MKRFLLYLIITTFLTPPVAWGDHHPLLVSEPRSAKNWTIGVNGLIYVSYDQNQNGKADFHTVRRVVTSFYSDWTVSKVGTSYPNHRIFFTLEDQNRSYYVTTAKPLFYAIDINEDGRWDLMFKDIAEDSVNGNEEFYDSPSGMFNKNTASPDIS